MDDKDIDKIAEKWNKYKKEITELEKKVQKYRDQIEREMNEQHINLLETDNYTISRIGCSKTTVSKKDMPEDIWDKYCKKSRYFMYNVKLKK
jgi:DNA-directed RNA polymerase subunit N (RpoN/RPB10)